MALTKDVVERLNLFFGGGFSIGDGKSFCWFTGDLGALRLKSQRFGEKLAQLEHQRATLAAKNAILKREVTVRDPSDEFFALVRSEQEREPGIPWSQARRRATEKNRPLSERAGFAMARPRPGQNTDHYQQEFFRRAEQIEKAEGCSFKESRLRAAARFPALRKAAFASTASERFFGAVEFEAETNKLTLDVAYRQVSLHLAADAVEVL